MDLLICFGDDGVEHRDLFAVLTLLMFAEAEEVGLVVRTVAIEEEEVLLQDLFPQFLDLSRGRVGRREGEGFQGDGGEFLITLLRVVDAVFRQRSLHAAWLGNAAHELKPVEQKGVLRPGELDESFTQGGELFVGTILIWQRGTEVLHGRWSGQNEAHTGGFLPDGDDEVTVGGEERG